MTLPSWPSDVNRNFIAGRYAEQFEDNIDSFDTDHGVPLRNRATSVPTFTISYDARLSPAEYASLIAFYRDTLACVDPFTRAHPLTGTTEVFKFAAAPKLVSIISFNKYQVSINLIHLPGP